MEHDKPCSDKNGIEIMSTRSCRGGHTSMEIEKLMSISVSFLQQYMADAVNIVWWPLFEAKKVFFESAFGAYQGVEKLEILDKSSGRFMYTLSVLSNDEYNTFLWPPCFQRYICTWTGNIYIWLLPITFTMYSWAILRLYNDCQIYSIVESDDEKSVEQLRFFK